MKNISTQQRRKNTLVAESKKKLLKENQTCRICGKFAHLDLAHILPRSLFPEHITNPNNHTLLCRECHNKFDNNITFRKLQIHLFNKVCKFDEIGANRYFQLNE